MNDDMTFPNDVVRFPGFANGRHCNSNANFMATAGAEEDQGLGADAQI
jgi:hypothetical protein